MSKIIYFSTFLLDDELRFEVQVLDHNEKFWIRLKSINDLRIDHFWSHDSGVTEAISYSSLIEELQKRIRAVRAGKFDIWDALQFWPSGWVYWGEGTPVPLDDYLGNSEYNRQLESYRKQNCLE